jgi:hypothetical protein
MESNWLLPYSLYRVCKSKKFESTLSSHFQRGDLFWKEKEDGEWIFALWGGWLSYWHGSSLMQIGQQHALGRGTAQSVAMLYAALSCSAGKMLTF